MFVREKKGRFLGPGMKSATRASGIVIIVNHSECFGHCFDDSSRPYANEIMINVSTMVNGWPSVKDGGLAIDGHWERKATPYKSRIAQTAQWTLTTYQ